jgi:hypothetical protein
LSGNLFVGDAEKTTESAVGVDSTAGKIYMFSNPNSKKRGIWDLNANDYVCFFDSNNDLTYRYGTFNGITHFSSNVHIDNTGRLFFHDSLVHDGTVPSTTHYLGIADVYDPDSRRTALIEQAVDTNGDQRLSFWNRRWTSTTEYKDCTLVFYNYATGTQTLKFNGAELLHTSNWDQHLPKIYNGTSTPSSSTGKNGDIYIVYSS